MLLQERNSFNTYLESKGSNKTLDLGGLVALLLAFLLGKRPLDHVLTYIILVGQVEKLANLASPLGSQTTGNGFVGQARNFLQR